MCLLLNHKIWVLKSYDIKILHISSDSKFVSISLQAVSMQRGIISIERNYLIFFQFSMHVAQYHFYPTF